MKWRTAGEEAQERAAGTSGARIRLGRIRRSACHTPAIITIIEYTMYSVYAVMNKFKTCIDCEECGRAGKRLGVICRTLPWMW